MAKKRKFVQETNRTFSLINPIQESMKDDVFRMSTDTMEKVKAQLYTLVFTNIGERVMMPDFGTNIQAMLFEPMSETVYREVRKSLDTAISKWIPAIIINEIEFVNAEENAENNTLNINIHYSLRVDSSITDQVQIEMSM